MSNGRHKIIVIGSGFGGLKAVKQLCHADADITLISATTHHLFQPLLYQVATGILSEGEIAPINRIILRHQENVEVVQGKVYDVDPQKKKVYAELAHDKEEYDYDSLIIATGSVPSYFGNDHYAQFAPGLKTIDDALELRARLMYSFERAETETDPVVKQRFLTFVVIGAGPNGVEIVGQIIELARKTFKGVFKTFTPEDTKVILIDASPRVLPPFSEKSSESAKKNLTKLGVEILLNHMVTDVNEDSITVKDKEGNIKKIDAYFKSWSAGVAADKLGKIVADRAGAEVDRAGRVKVSPDLTLPGYPDVFVIGDLAFVEGVPGQAPGAIQGGTYAAKSIIAAINGEDPLHRKPFKYFDKGAMAQVARYKAVMEFRKLTTTGLFAWVAWLVLHLYYIVGFQNRFLTVSNWLISFLSISRGQLSSTPLQVHARNAYEKELALEKKSHV